MSNVKELLGDKASFYLDHVCKTVDKSLLHIPSPNIIDDVWSGSDRNVQTLRSLQSILSHGRLANKIGRAACRERVLRLV